MISFFLIFFFFNDTATTEIYTLSLHDALPIWVGSSCSPCAGTRSSGARSRRSWRSRSEEHTSELQSRPHLVCRLLLEKKTTAQPLGVQPLPYPSDNDRSCSESLSFDSLPLLRE